MMRRWPQLFACLLLVPVVSPLVAAISASAQTSPLEKSFGAPNVEVEKTLRSLQAHSGRLPILDGFVATSDLALDRYQRGYYQYSIQIIPQGPAHTNVRVSAKITAWYAAQTPALSGYRVLPSNGRLEADLLDRLQEALSGRASNIIPEDLTPRSEVGNLNRAADTKKSLPDNPGSSSVAAFPTTSTNSPLLPSRQQALASKAPPGAEDQRVLQLTQEAKNLEDILHNQTHLQNLVTIKQSHTAVYDRPLDEAKVLFFADAEDEFQLVNTAGAWVHVQVSGISRGWIRRTEVVLPSSASLPDATSAGNNPVQPQPISFRPTREETSMFPGNWSALRGKTVKVVWVQAASDSRASEPSKVEFAKSVFRKSYSQMSKTNSGLAGVVIVFDSEDGGMAAATSASIQQWNAGHLSDSAFWRQCWLEPVDAFGRQD